MSDIYHQREVCRRFENTDWDKLLPDLLLFTLYKINELKFRGSKGTSDTVLVEGKMAEDIVMDAITKVLIGDYNWDFNEKNDLDIYLKMVIKGLVSNMVRKKENVAETGLDVTNDRKIGECESFPTTSSVKIDHPIDELYFENLKEKIYEIALEDELWTDIVDCIERDIMTPQEIAAEVGRPVEDIYNAKRAMKRRWAKKYDEDLEMMGN